MATSDMSPWLSALASLLSLAFVLSLAWLMLRWLKRGAWGTGGGGREGPQVLRAVSLGSRERLVVVKHNDIELLLGVTASSVTVLERRHLSQAPAADASAAMASDPTALTRDG